MEKERRTKALLLSTLVVVVATLSIAFAAMSQVLNINGIGKMDTASWSVYFDNLGDANIVRGAEEVGKPSISNDKGTVQDINVKLSNPKDEISYTVDIVNDGTIDAEITMIKDIELTDVQKKVFEFKVTYTDTGEILQNGDILPKDTTKNITINIKFKDDITEADLPTENQVINLSYQLTYTQYDGSEVVIEPDGGEIVRNQSTLNYLWYEPLYEENESFFEEVESITFLNHVNVPDNAKNTIMDASYEKNNSILMWYTDNNSNGYLEIYFGSNDEIVVYITEEDYENYIDEYDFNPYASYFSGFSELKEINFNNNVNTSKVTDMRVMFGYCPSLTTLDLSGWDFSSVEYAEDFLLESESVTHLDLSYTNFSGMDDSYIIFDEMDIHLSSVLEYINLNNANLSSITDMSDMFDNLTNLTTLNMNNIKLSGSVSMSGMFYGREIIPTINFSVDKSSDVEIDMTEMFSECTSLTSLDLSNFDTSKVVNMNMMFYRCSSLTSLDLSSFDTSSVAEMGSMFRFCNSLQFLNLDSFNTKNVTNMHAMFSECISLTSLNLSSFDTSSVTGMGSMFYNCSSLTNLDVSSFNTSNVTSMLVMFYNCLSLTSLDLSNWDTSNVEAFNDGQAGMFQDCSLLTSLNLSGWDASKATEMGHMFYGCSSLETLNLSGFKTKAIESAHYMFYGCSKLVELDMSLFETSNLTYTYGMFRDCSSLTILKLNSADFSKNDGNYSYMFSNCNSLTTVYVKDEENKTLLTNFGAGRANFIIDPLTS